MLQYYLRNIAIIYTVISNEDGGLSLTLQSHYTTVKGAIFQEDAGTSVSVMNIEMTRHLQGKSTDMYIKSLQICA